MVKTASERLLPWTVYPATLLLGIGGHLALLNAGYPLVTSTYLPVLVGALLVTGLEHAIPHQPGWKPGRSDIANDALASLYMRGEVTLEEAMKRSSDPTELLRAVGEPVPTE